MLPQQGGHRVGLAGVTTFCRKAFTRRSSLRSELRTLGTPVVDDATVDVLGMCLYASPLDIYRITSVIYAIYSKGVLYSYRRGLRSCLSLQGGKFEGQEREVSNGYGSHAFLLL